MARESLVESAQRVAFQLSKRAADRGDQTEFELAEFLSLVLDAESLKDAQHAAIETILLIAAREVRHG